MHLFEKNIKDLGLEIPEPPSAVANYVPYKIADNLVFISDNFIYKNLDTKLISDKIRINLLTKDIKIFMNEENKKIKIENKN